MPPPPTKLILEMRGKGMSNNSISQELNRQGYSSHDIFEAFNMADNNQPFATNTPPPNMQPPPLRQPMPNSMAAPQPGFTTQPHTDDESLQEIEELIETVIEEKWNELKKSIEQIANWKEKADQKIGAIQQQTDDLRREFDKVHQAILGKIGEYDKNILEVGSELKAMEKVFSKVLPAFTDNVNELGRIANKLSEHN